VKLLQSAGPSADCLWETKGQGFIDPGHDTSEGMADLAGSSLKESLTEEARLGLLLRIEVSPFAPGKISIIALKTFKT